MHVISRWASAALVGVLLLTPHLAAGAERSEPSGLSTERLINVIDPQQQLVAIIMVHTPAVGLGFDFENVVMQAVLDD